MNKTVKQEAFIHSMRVESATLKDKLFLFKGFTVFCVSVDSVFKFDYIKLYCMPHYQMMFPISC